MRYITPQQYEELTQIPRGRMAIRSKIYVGALVVKNDTILLTKTKHSKYPGWQLPGGRVLWNEKYIDALTREVLEETGFDVKPLNVVGFYQRETKEDEEEFLRVIYLVKPIKKKDIELDENIKESKWFNIKDVLSKKVKLQSEIIRTEIQDYTNGKLYPLEILNTYIW
jgi:ADP-ribose pyrophosphatase YjhB (NUDIX family)